MNLKHPLPVATFLALTAMLTLLSSVAPRGMAADECVGKPYGYPGCPSLDASSSVSSAMLHCGDDTLQTNEGEECDDGRLNGVGSCTKECKLLTCGDGVVSRQIGEECEPRVEVVYVNDPATGNLTTERRFVANTCGNYCQPPVFDVQHKLISGCTLKFQAACTVSSASASGSVAAQTIALSSSKSSQSDSSVSLGSSSSSVALSISSAVSSAMNSSASPAVSSATIVTPPVCGNGVLDSGEQCDEGLSNGTGRCTMLCLLADQKGICGNGLREANEECDLGLDNGRDSCTTSCKLPRCGDGIRQGTEECDDGAQNGKGKCSLSCTVPTCGNAVREPGEECDNGPDNSDKTANACRTSCKLAWCGDGVLDAHEECDGGANCTVQCKNKLIPAAQSSVQPTPPTSSITELPKNTNVLIRTIGVTMLIITVILTYLLWNNILRLLGLKRAKSIEQNLDDVPLDQIEMPWQKW